METEKFTFAPINNKYMAISIVGLLISLYYLMDPTIQIGVFFVAFFLVMFIITFLSKEISFPYMIASLIGFVASLIFAQIPDPTWGVTFVIFFGYMFFTSVVSMTRADPNSFVELETHHPTANKHSAKKRKHKLKKK
jgi:hypothetical protein